MPDPSAYYISRKPRLLREFDRYVKYTRPVLIRYFGEDNVIALIGETRREYENLIPQLPYIGGTQPFTQFIISTGMLLAVYWTAKGHGKALAEIGELIYEISRALLRAYPAFLVRFFGNMNFSKFYLSRLRKRAIASHQREYPDGYVYDFIEGERRTFDYGVDYIECASCKFLSKQGAYELAPYLCTADILYSEALGWGLMRTKTLAEGAEKCDFRFKKGGPTKVAVPDAMRHVIARNE